MVDPRFDWGVTRVTPKQFERQIVYLLEQGYNIQTLSDYLRSGSPLPSEKRVCITFDDAYESVYTWAFPILAKYKLPATIFVIASFAGQMNTWDVNIGWLRFQHLDWQQIRSLSDLGWEINSHSFSHRDLTRLADSELVFELEMSKGLIERRIKRDVKHFSYPFGKVNNKVAKATEQAGYEAAVILDHKSRHIHPDFIVPRLGVYLFDTMIPFRQKVTGQAKWIHRATQRVIGYCSTGSVLVKEKL